MALAVVQHKFGSTNANQNTVAVTVTSTGGGNLLVAGTYNNGTMTVSGVSDGTNNFTQFAGAQIANSNRIADCWYLSISTSGKTTITATFSVTNTSRKIAWVWEVSGFSVPTTDGVAGTTGTAQNPTGASLTTKAVSGFLAAVCGYANTISTNPAAGNEFTSGGDIADGNGGCSLISSSATAHQPAWSGDQSSAFTTFTAAFKEAIPPLVRVPFPSGLTPLLAMKHNLFEPPLSRRGRKLRRMWREELLKLENDHAHRQARRAA